MKFNQDKECNQASLKLADLGLLLLCVFVCVKSWSVA